MSNKNFNDYNEINENYQNLSENNMRNFQRDNSHQLPVDESKQHCSTLNLNKEPQSFYSTNVQTKNIRETSGFKFKSGELKELKDYSTSDKLLSDIFCGENKLNRNNGLLYNSRITIKII